MKLDSWRNYKLGINKRVQVKYKTIKIICPVVRLHKATTHPRQGLPAESTRYLISLFFLLFFYFLLLLLFCSMWFCILIVAKKKEHLWTVSQAHSLSNLWLKSHTRIVTDNGPSLVPLEKGEQCKVLKILFIHVSDLKLGVLRN